MINQIHKIFNSFFWSKVGGDKGKHRVSWDELCYPQIEGGVGFMSLYKVAKAFISKLWWNFRTSTSFMWGNYRWNKYYQKDHSCIIKGITSSLIWSK